MNRSEYQILEVFAGFDRILKNPMISVSGTRIGILLSDLTGIRWNPEKLLQFSIRFYRNYCQSEYESILAPDIVGIL